MGNCFVDGLIHRDENAVYNCLRAYASEDYTQNAKEIFRSTVVAPLVQKGTPYTSSRVVGGFTGDELEDDYKQIKNLIAQDCTFLLEISSTGICSFFIPVFYTINNIRRFLLHDLGIIVVFEL